MYTHQSEAATNGNGVAASESKGTPATSRRRRAKNSESGNGQVTFKADEGGAWQGHDTRTPEVGLGDAYDGCVCMLV